jgi:hypothetical protein
MTKWTLLAAAAALAGIGAAARADDAEKSKPRQYRIDLKIVEYDAEEKKSSVCQPVMVVVENRPGRFFAGQEIANSEDTGKVEFLEVGSSAEVVVRPLPGGKVRLDASVRYSWREPAPKSKLRVRTNGVRVIETVRLGETFREELDEDPDTGGSRVVEITVQEADEAGK